MAASLLSTDDASMGFGGYVGSSRVHSTLASTPDAPTSLDIDVEVAQHLRRFSRKDPTTKTNELKNLADECAQQMAKYWLGDSNRAHSTTEILCICFPILISNS